MVEWGREELTEGKDPDWFERNKQAKTQIESIDYSSGLALFPGSDTDRC